MGPTDPLENINSVAKVMPPKELGLQSLAQAICVERLHKLETRGKEKVIQVQGRHARMRFMNNVIRMINNAQADKNDEIDLENHLNLKELKEDVKKMELEANFLEVEANGLEKEAEEILKQVQEVNSLEASQMKKKAAEKKEKAKAKQDEAVEFKDIKQAMQLLLDTKKLTKEQKTKLLENCRSCFEDLNNINQLDLQTANRLNHERHETLLLARMILKTLHDDIIHKARAISGRG